MALRPSPPAVAPPALAGPDLAAETCARRLEPVAAELAGLGIESAVSWHGAATLPNDLAADEATVQARTGLMHLHGRESGRPRRLGLEVATVAAGAMAAQGVLAAAIASRRDQAFAGVETSVLAGGLWSLAHHLAAATSGDPWVPAPEATDPGPPFRSAEGRWFEIETLDPYAWKAFWTDLGAGGADLGRAWALFRPRYYRGTCSLPPGLHATTVARPLADLVERARSHEVSLVPLRRYDDVLAHLGAWPGHPVLSPAPGPEPVRAVPRSPAELPLNGLVLIEAASRMQGPLAGLLLQMLGARVVKVEPPGGDVGRGVPPLADGVGSFFRCCNRGKECAEIDLASPTGRAELVELVEGADAFLHNWRPGKAAAWGLSAEDLLSRHPSLVYAEASGWGQHSPDPGLVGTDFLLQAHAGVGAGLEPADRPAFPSRLILVDFFGALVTAEGILRGLFQREVRGGGTKVGTSLLAGAMALQAHVLADLAAGRERGRRRGRPLWGPLDEPLPTADGWLAVAAGEGSALRRACGLPGGADPSTVAHRLRSDSSAHWERALTHAGITAAAVATDLSAVAGDPHLAPLFEPLAGGCRAPASPWRFRR